MRTIKEVKTLFPDRAKEIEAVIRQFGDREDWMESVEDIVNHGAAAGVSGFVYYSETVPFARRNRKMILSRLLEDCEGMEIESPASWIRSWKIVGSDFSLHEINQVLYTGRCDDFDAESGNGEDMILNALAWYLLEDVASLFVD